MTWLAFKDWIRNKQQPFSYTTHRISCSNKNFYLLIKSFLFPLSILLFSTFLGQCQAWLNSSRAKKKLIKENVFPTKEICQISTPKNSWSVWNLSFIWRWIFTIYICTNMDIFPFDIFIFPTSNILSLSWIFDGYHIVYDICDTCIHNIKLIFIFAMLNPLWKI